MALLFDRVIPRLLEVGIDEPTLSSARKVAVIRDPTGRIRLALEAPGVDATARAGLATTLKRELGDWYAGPALFAEGTRPEQRLVAKVFERARDRWPGSWPDEVEDPVRGTKTQLDARWVGVERVLSKQSWLSDQEVRSPWPLHDKTPTIVSFYSYKGGVGRSTLLAIVAALLSQAGETVVVVDLDLEAPGQQALFDVRSSRGVIDYLVEHLALGSEGFDDLCVDVTANVPGAKGKVMLAAAGKAGWSYIEKIARLDFAGHTSPGDGGSPVQAALESLLKNVKAHLKPQWILLDARTGIHDLGGLAIHALAHIDVLLVRDGRQGRDGLEFCLEALGRRRHPDEILPLVVHAHVPAPLSDKIVSKPIQDEFREQTYELFRRTLYEPLGDDIPAQDDTDVAHTPHCIPLDTTLARLEALSQMEEFIGRPHYAEIVARLRGLAEAEEEP